MSGGTGMVVAELADALKLRFFSTSMGVFALAEKIIDFRQGKCEHTPYSSWTSLLFAPSALQLPK